MTKQSDRRKLAKLRACVMDGKPWAIMPQAMGQIEAMIDAGDLENGLNFGGSFASETKIINGVAVIPVTGVLRDEVDFMVRFGMASSYQVIERDFKAAMRNSEVKGVLFYIDSPGGSAIGVKRVADAVHEARGDKPIRSYVQGVAASAAYYLAAATDHIDATADSYVGSVGTILPHMNASKAFAEMGVEHTVITNAGSPKKGHGNIYEPLSDEAKATLQGFVESYGQPFIEDVARYRGVEVSAVTANFGQGDGVRASNAIGRGMVDSIVTDFQASLDAISNVDSEASPVEGETDEAVASAIHQEGNDMKVSAKVRAQLFALGIIADMEASDEICLAALGGKFGGNVPEDEAKILDGLQNKSTAAPHAEERAQQQLAVQQAHDAEQKEAKLEDLKASQKVLNSAAGKEIVTAEMVIDSLEAGHTVAEAGEAWGKLLAENEKAIQSAKVTGEGSDRYAKDVVDALLWRSQPDSQAEISDDAKALANRPLWAVAAECLQQAGSKIDPYGPREIIAEEAMQMGNQRRATFFSEKENGRYVNLQAAGTPFNRPGDFPNILANLANKFLDTIQLDDDYSYPAVSAVLPGGLNDFKPAMMVNKGIVEELDELSDAEKFKELGLSEEVLSYLFIRRFGNKFGWTPVMVANDDIGAFAEGMIGLAEAWEVTQNRLVVDRFTTTETLLDSSALFANRADTGTATNDNRRTSGGNPSDAEWAAMEEVYADIGGIATGRRVRGMLNVAFCPTGTSSQEAKRTFAPLAQLEPKQAATTANVGIFRGQVSIVPESELRAASSTTWYGLRNPTALNTATVVRAYFNGFGTGGRRERWFDPEDKTTWVSVEGRVAVATKNWRYAIRNTA